MTGKTPHDSCCSAERHLVILGGGSAAFAAALKASELGHRATIVNAGLPSGGTCVNVGCVPSKFLIRAAGKLHDARHSRYAGIDGSGRLTDLRALMSQKRSLVEGLRQGKYLDVIADDPAIQLIEGRGCLRDSHTVEVNGKQLKADCILIATGAHPRNLDVSQTNHSLNSRNFPSPSLSSVDGTSRSNAPR